MRITIDRVFLVYMAVVGAAVGAILAVAPEARNYRIAPYFWILIAMAAFEMAAFARAQGVPGTMLAMPFRLAGFGLAILFMILIPIVAGSPGRLF